MIANMSSAGDDGMGESDEERAFVRVENLLVSEVDGESVILDQNSEVYYGINEVGSHIWERVEEPRTVEELVESTSTAYDVSREECREDIEDFLTDLLDAGLVERV